MGKPMPVTPVKLFTGILCADDALLEGARRTLENRFGPVDYVSSRFLFDLTNYYENEMGASIGRWFWSFERLIDPGILPQVKLFTNDTESEFAGDGKRKINLDPGYLDFHKVILASVKERAQKIYLGSGIYADPTLYYLKGRFHCYDWSLPDFKTDLYYPVFEELRKLYRTALRIGWLSAGGSPSP
jgi:hypothetical protein